MTKQLSYAIPLVWLVLFYPFSLFAENTSGTEELEEEIRIIEKQERPASIPAGFGSSRIRDWQVLDDDTIIIEAVGRKKYKATFMAPCQGIRFTAVIALSNRGSFELDKFTTVILPDGERCRIRELTEYTAEMEQQDQEQNGGKK